MRRLFSVVVGLGANILLLFALGEGNFLWGIVGFGLLIAAAGLWGPNRRPVDPPPSSRQASTSDSPPNREDSATKEGNRRLAIKLQDAGGAIGRSAQWWLNAYEHDPSVPMYGVAPYWDPAEPSGLPVATSMTAFHGVKRRLRDVQDAADGDGIVWAMAKDPDPRVRSAAHARIEAWGGGTFRLS